MRRKRDNWKEKKENGSKGGGGDEERRLDSRKEGEGRSHGGCPTNGPMVAKFLDR